jgi:hypothetical protein
MRDKQRRFVYLSCIDMQMYLKVLAVIMIFVIAFTTETSYGQTIQSQNGIQVFSQIQIRDSHGQLKAYLEPDMIHLESVNIISHFLNSKSKSMITKDGQKFEQIQFEEKGIFNKSDEMSQYNLVYGTGPSKSLVLTLKFDGFPVRPGDSYDIWWTILSPVG